MGKAKKKKFSAPKPQPTGLPSVRDFEAELELTGNVEATPAALQAIVEKLQSTSEECRECGCMTLAALVSEPGAIKLLLKQNIVKILAPLVLDHSWEVRHRALGALRNMSVDGGAEVCEHMVDKDVLTPLLALIHQFGAGDQFSDEEKKKRRDLICDAYSHAFYLLLNLCENSGTAVTTFNKDNLLPVLCPILDSSQYSDDLKLSVVEFLHTVTEDNTEMSRPELRASIQSLMSVTTNSSQLMLLKMLATGILVNLEGGKLSSASGELVVPIVTTLGDVLSVDVAGMLMACQTDSDSGGAAKLPEDGKKENEGDKHTNQDIQNLLKAQKVALEIVTNLCCSDDDDWEEMGSESSSDEAMDVPVEEEMCTDGALAPLCVSTELHSAFVSNGIVAKVLQAAQPLTDDQVRAVGEGDSNKALINRFVVKQTHALLCLSNLVGALDIEALGGVDKLHAVWQGLSQLSSSCNGDDNRLLLESVTLALRAVISKMALVDPSKFQDVTSADLQVMFEMSTCCPMAEIRVNAIRVVSTVATILAQNKTPHPLHKDVGVFLLEVVNRDADLWVVAEALDAMFDVFGEDHLDPVVREIGLVEKLKTLAPGLKSKIHANRKNLGEHYPVISTARTNLVRYIKYKSTH